MKNPVIEEWVSVVLHRREYLLFHVIYLTGTAVLTLLVWPARGFLYYFQSNLVPPSFEVLVIFQVVTLSVMSLYAGMDRLASDGTIRYTEWIEHTTIPVMTLLQGKIAGAVLHSALLVAMATPFVVVAAGPSGMPLRIVGSSLVIVLLSTVIARITGLIISHLGETRYVIRVVGSWIFLALFYVATIQLLPPLNPVIALVGIYREGSPLLDAGAAIVATGHPLFAPAVAMSAMIAVLIALYGAGLARHRHAAGKEATL